MLVRSPFFIFAAMSFIFVVGVTVLLPDGVYAQVIGQQRTFFVSKDFDSVSRTQVQATLRSVGVHALAYVEDAYFTSLSASAQQEFLSGLGELLEEFDTAVYPELTAFLGKPWEPGIDDDSRIVILFTKLLQNFGGYVNTADEFSKTQAANSNEAELIYFNAVYIGNLRAKAFLAHEFQHLITFNEKERGSDFEEDVWLNELRSEYVSTFLGYDDTFAGSNLQARTGAFLAEPSDSLTEWNGDAADYGSVNLFGQYLNDRFGQTFFPEAVKEISLGIPSVEAALETLGEMDDFATAVLSWHVANWVNDPTIDDGRWGYSNPNLHSSDFRIEKPTADFRFTSSAQLEATQTVSDWAGYWFRLSPQSISGMETLALVVEALGENAAPNAALIVEHVAGPPEVRPLVFAAKKAEDTVEGFGSIVSSVVIAFVNSMQKGDFTETALQTQIEIQAQVLEGPTIAVTDVAPTQVFTTGGETITIFGEGFSEDMTARVDATFVPVTFIDANTIRITAPVHDTGTACLVLATPSGAAITRCDLFSYREPFPDGSLVKTANDPRVWVMKGSWRRHIISSETFSFYDHLLWENVRVVDQGELELYSVSTWVRADQDTRVYEINADEFRHWLNMTAGQFSASTRSWDGVFLINAQERDFYTNGADVLFR